MPPQYKRVSSQSKQPTSRPPRTGAAAPPLASGTAHPSQAVEQALFRPGEELLPLGPGECEG
jgi:hypothetical protein